MFAGKIKACKKLQIQNERSERRGQVRAWQGADADNTIQEDTYD